VAIGRGPQFDALRALGADLPLAVLAYEPVGPSARAHGNAEPGAGSARVSCAQRSRRPGAEGVMVLYGGSVKAANAAALFAQRMSTAARGRRVARRDGILAIAGA
jgi:triosephosphate isomerase